MIHVEIHTVFENKWIGSEEDIIVALQNTTKLKYQYSTAICQENENENEKLYLFN